MKTNPLSDTLSSFIQNERKKAKPAIVLFGTIVFQQ